ncbi:hypothetical protein DD238_003295 [Peronospora effusa]|uniref:Uncharacterized protein n=1 Tax=Peronospora effusa TaxID=542832 RepID=A0A3M6VM67_9STRA|nr:hypothetical protein DD238_003295 [Peronospora effusa]
MTSVVENLALVEVKIPIIGYTAYSFSPRFGLYDVTFSSSTNTKDNRCLRAATHKIGAISRPVAKWFGHEMS